MSPAISSSVRPSAAVRVMKPPTDPGTLALQNALQPQALFVAGDLARDADVFERRHVDHEAAGQGDVRSDARALLAQRLLGDLNDDLLAFFQQVGDGRSAALARIARARGRAAGRLRGAVRASASARCSRGSARLLFTRASIVRPIPTTAAAAAIAARNAMRKASAPFADFRGAAGRLGSRLSPRRLLRRLQLLRGFRLGFAFEIRFGRPSSAASSSLHRRRLRPGSSPGCRGLRPHPSMGAVIGPDCGRVFQVGGFLRADGFFRQGRRRCEMCPSDFASDEASDPSGAECAGASGRAFSGG